MPWMADEAESIISPDQSKMNLRFLPASRHRLATRIHAHLHKNCTTRAPREANSVRCDVRSEPYEHAALRFVRQLAAKPISVLRWHNVTCAMYWYRND